MNVRRLIGLSRPSTYKIDILWLFWLSSPADMKHMYVCHIVQLVVFLNDIFHVQQEKVILANLRVLVTHVNTCSVPQEQYTRNNKCFNIFRFVYRIMCAFRFISDTSICTLYFWHIFCYLENSKMQVLNVRLLSWV